MNPCLFTYLYCHSHYRLDRLTAYFGYTPTVATTSLHNFRSHIGFLMNPIYTKDGIAKASIQSFRHAFTLHFYYYLVNALLYSILAPCNYQPFPTSTPVHKVFVSIRIQHLCNNFIAAGTTDNKCFSYHHTLISISHHYYITYSPRQFVIVF